MKEISFFTKTLFKFALVLIGLIMLAIACYMLLTWVYIEQNKTGEARPSYLYSLTKSENLEDLSETSKTVLKKNKIWFLVLSDKGNYVQSYFCPEHLQKDYTVQELIKASRWYMDDYPVFTFVHADKILIFGYPKDSIIKLANNYMTLADFNFLFSVFLITTIVTLMLIFLLYYHSKRKIMKEIVPIAKSIEELSQGRNVKLSGEGELRDIKHAIQLSSDNLARAHEDRNKWLRGISHDIRTPLTLINAKIDQLEQNCPSTEINQIKINLNRIESILSGLNNLYTLGSVQQLENPCIVHIDSLLRDLSVELLNTIDADFSIEILGLEHVSIIGDKKLLERAVRNILLNSILHNREVKIEVQISSHNEEAILCIKDNGSISKEKIDSFSADSPIESTHSFGIRIVKKIVELHEANITFKYNNPGLITTIVFSKAHEKEI